MFHKNKAVERVLQENTQARGDDKLLQLEVWQLYGFHLSETQRKIFLSDTIPSPETIRRTRQRLQEQGKYLPSLTKINERKNFAIKAKQSLVEEKIGSGEQASMFDKEFKRKLWF